MTILAALCPLETLHLVPKSRLNTSDKDRHTEGSLGVSQVSNNKKRSCTWLVWQVNVNLGQQKKIPCSVRVKNSCVKLGKIAAHTSDNPLPPQTLWVWYTSASLTLTPLSRVQNIAERMGQFCRRRDSVPCRDNHVFWVSLTYMSRKEGRSCALVTKQPITFCAAIHLIHSSSHLSIFLCPPFPVSTFPAHIFVFHHTYPHLHFTNPIYCYPYLWLLSSLLLLLFWLELLSSCATFLPWF